MKLLMQKLFGMTLICGFTLLFSQISLSASESEASVSEPSVSEQVAALEDASASELWSWQPFGPPKTFGAPPALKTGPLEPEVAEAMEVIFGANLHSNSWGSEQSDAMSVISSSGDPRLAWVISDLMRIAGGSQLFSLLGKTASELLGVDVAGNDSWGMTTDHLIAWDIPEPPDYLMFKRSIYTLIVPQWENIFVEGDIDWRHVSWGGVRIDDREFGKTDQLCNCIPAADNPEVTAAEKADWLDDDAVVFGIEVNGEYRAYPRQIMEVREMVNDTLGGRDLGIPYCTLCGAAQAYFTDQIADDVERPVLRTSGLLIRSNKVMYDVNTYSVFDTFKGNAVTGPLAEKGVVLKQAGVVTTTWGSWKKAHPETTVLDEKLALGRDFDFRNNRDANGPIFPIGNVDIRLTVHEDILGVITESGTPVAFPIKDVLDKLNQGETVSYENINLVLDAGGVRAVDDKGMNIGSHQAFWFAWSQFYPNTQLWTI